MLNLGIVKSYLVRLGLIDAAGNPAAAGVENPMTAALDAGGYNITNVGVVTGGELEWQTCTVTATHTTNATTTAKYRRLGDSIELIIKTAYTGATDAAVLVYTLPTIGVALSWDTTKLLTENFVGILGMGTLLDSGSANYQISALPTADANEIAPAAWTADGSYSLNTTSHQLSNSVPVTIASGDRVWLYVRGPIAEWAS